MTITDSPHELLNAGQALSSDWEIGMIFQILRRKAWVIAVWILIMPAVGVVYLLITPKVYQGTTVVQVQQDERPPGESADIAPESINVPEILKTFEQNLDSGALLLRVFKVNKLDQDSRYLGEQHGLFRPVIKWLARLFSGNREGPADAELIRDMDDRTVVKIRKGSRLIDVNVRAQDPSLAVQLSQSLVNEYIRLDSEQKIEAAKPAFEYWVQKAERLKDNLQNSEQLLQKYKEEQQAVSLEESQNIVVQTLKMLNASLSDSRAARIKLESDFAQLEAAGGHTNELLALPSIAASPDVLALKQRIAELEGIFSGLGQRYAPKSPRYLEAGSELQKLKLSLENEIQDAAGTIKTSYMSAKNSEDKLLAEVREQEKHALELNRIALQYHILSRDVASNQALYDAMLKQLKQTQVIQGVGQGGIRVVEPPTLPDKPAWPRKLIVLPVALFLGGIIGVCAAIGSIFHKAPLMGVADAERQLRIPAVAAIPKARSTRRTKNIFLLDYPRSPAAEAIRSLRAMLLLGGRDGKDKVILFTSAMAREGKTFCAVNSAAALAMDGRRTLLIDANLRSPAIGFQLFGKQPVRGLADVLSGQADFESAVQPSKLDNLFVLSAGSPTDKPSEVLGSSQMLELLAKASASYAHIVLDGAPILEASDALRLVQHAHIVCLVARSAETPGRAVARAIQLLTTAENSAPVGLVLNRTLGRFDI